MDEAPTTRLTDELAAAVETAAAWRGMSSEQYVHEVLTVATGLDAKLAADLKLAEDDLDAGRFYTQEEVEAMFSIPRERRDAA